MSLPEKTPKREIERVSRRVELTARFVDNLAPEDSEVRYTDVKVSGLTLTVIPASKNKPNGSKRWHFRYVFAGKASMVALGEYPTVCLADAREKAWQAKKDIEQGISPSHRKKMARQAEQGAVTFQTVAEAWLEHFNF